MTDEGHSPRKRHGGAKAPEQAQQAAAGQGTRGGAGRGVPSRRRPAVNQLIQRASRAGADDALAALINQFADPLSFLRELVQNSLDAASSRVDVDFAFEAPEKEKGKKQPEGLMTITVADNGEGMNEGVIDNYLLTLFSSTKEQDLTKIGKFGVGFVSIFAIEPQLVVLETGQAGESWRVIFHADQSYEKLRLDVPVEGTTVALHKQITQGEFDKLRDKGRETVRYWCKYAEVEINVDGEPIGEAFDIESPLSVRYQEPGTELWVGLAPVGSDGNLAPLVGFYNRGLTLVEGGAFPGDEQGALGGLSMRIKSRYLEHTLTRDNVLQDESFDKAMALVRAQIEGPLRAALVQRLEALAEGKGKTPDDGPALALGLYYARLPAMRLHQTAPHARVFPKIDGGATSFSKLEKQVVVAAQSNAVTNLLADRGVEVLRAEFGVVEHLKQCGQKVLHADVLYFTAVPLEGVDTRGVPELVRRLLEQAKARVNRVALGDLSYPGSLRAGALHVRQDEAFGLTRTGEDRPGLLGGAREVVLNSSHPLTHHCLALAASDPPLAALLLAQEVCLLEGIDASELAATTVGWTQKGGAA
jgi:hypothetical protein